MKSDNFIMSVHRLTVDVSLTTILLLVTDMTTERLMAVCLCALNLNT